MLGGGLIESIAPSADLGHGTVPSREENPLSNQPPAKKLVIPCDVSWQSGFARRSVEVGKEEMSEMFLILGNLFGV